MISVINKPYDTFIYLGDNILLWTRLKDIMKKKLLKVYFGFLLGVIF